MMVVRWFMEVLMKHIKPEHIRTKDELVKIAAEYVANGGQVTRIERGKSGFQPKPLTEAQAEAKAKRVPLNIVLEDILSANDLAKLGM
jgi:hypothetical protein